MLQGEIEMVEAGIRRGSQSPIPELDVLWITAGLGCDGDTIAMTAATQPSIEDILLGQIPWTPRVTLHNPFLALANGDDFMKAFHSGPLQSIYLYAKPFYGKVSLTCPRDLEPGLINSDAGRGCGLSRGLIMDE